jgi:hypothetical protein
VARPDGAAERLAERGEGRVLAVVAVDELQPSRQSLERLRVGAVAVLAQARVHPRDDGIAARTAAGHADHDVRQAAAPLEVLEGGEDLLEREVAGDAEDHQCVARCGVRGLQGLPVPFSVWIALVRSADRRGDSLQAPKR